MVRGGVQGGFGATLGLPFGV
ncbi:hypothetical protein LINPERHAP1_LOCUS22079 [Linum perenne]